MDVVLEKILAEHADERYAVQDVSNVQTVLSEKLIPLKLNQLAKIKPGMYWYEDNTVSGKLNATKKVKSVVLQVKDNVVYGDSFEQRYVLGKKISSYLKETSAKLFAPVCRPKTEDLVKLYDAKKAVNKTLKSLKKLPWSEELYWAEDGKIVDLFDASEHSMGNEQGAYFRPMITLQVK